MRLSFLQACAPRKALFAVAAIAAFALAGPAAARTGQGVVVASSSPNYAAGTVVEPGERLRIEEGASITVLEEDGRLSTIDRSGPFSPRQAEPALRTAQRNGASIVDSLAILLGGDRHIRTSGGVRALDNATAPDPCAEQNDAADFPTLQLALSNGCDAHAAAILARWVERDAPPQVYARLLDPPPGAPETMQIQVQANFEAYLYCRMRRADASMIALTPEQDALPLRLAASQTHALTLPASEPGPGRAVQCMAVGARAAAAPDVGAWPEQLDPQRIEDTGATVATVLLPLPQRH